MGRTAKHPRRRTPRRERPKTKVTPRRRQAARGTIATDEGPAPLDDEFHHGDDWLEPYEPSEEVT